MEGGSIDRNLTFRAGTNLPLIRLTIISCVQTIIPSNCIREANHVLKAKSKTASSSVRCMRLHHHHDYICSLRSHVTSLFSNNKEKKAALILPN